MAGPADSVLDRVRNPAYVGENRCVPCTVLNLAIALLTSALAALVALELGVAVFALSVALVALRGYLVPGTPALTQRYLPDRVLAAFDHASAGGSDDRSWGALEKVEYEREHAVDPERFLLEVGVLDSRDATDGGAETSDGCAETSDGDDASAGRTDASTLARGFGDDIFAGSDLSAAFEDHLTSHVEARRRRPPDREALAAMLDADSETVSVDDRGHPAVTAGSRVRHWPSEIAVDADVATHEALVDWTDRWSAVPLEQRLDVLRSLRLARGTCPGCDGDPSVRTETVDSCCRPEARAVAAVECGGCGHRLLEFGRVVR